MLNLIFTKAINFILDLLINLKFFIISTYNRQYSDFDILELKLYDTNEIHIIKNRKAIHNILFDNWITINEYNKNINMIDIEYLYKDKRYNIIYKYGNNIDFPIEFKQSNIKLLYTNDDINDIILKYAGPMKDFYNKNSQQITIQDIFIFNNITYDKEIIIVNSNLSEKQINLQEIIDLKI